MEKLVKTGFFKELIKIAYSLDAAPVSVDNDTAGGPPPTPWTKKKLKVSLKKEATPKLLKPVNRAVTKGAIKIRRLARAADKASIKLFLSTPTPVQKALTKSTQMTHAPSDAEAGAGWVRPVITLGSKLIGS